MYARAGAGPPLIVTLPKNVVTPCGIDSLLRHADAADGAAGTDDAQRGHGRLLEADALEDGVSAESVRQLAHALDRFVAALAHDVRRAEVLRERDARGMTAEQDHLLGAEAPRRDHAAQADGAVPDDGGGLPGCDLRRTAPRGGRSPSRR